MRPFITYPIRLTPLSPIHIGSGFDLDWTQAVQDGSRMVTFDPMRVEWPATAAQGLMQAADKRDPGQAMVALQKHFGGYKKALLAASTGHVRLTEPVAQKFRKSFGHNTQARQGSRDSVVSDLHLARHAIDAATGLPYVPGSGLKGAMRTAVVAGLDGPPKAAGPRPPSSGHGKPEWRDPSDDLLGRFQASTFSRVMLSDLRPVVGADSGLAAVVKPNRRRYKEGKAEFGVPVTAELISPYQPGAYAGELRIGASRGAGDPVMQLPDCADLMRTTHRFHLWLFNAFANILRSEQRGLAPGWLDAMQQLLAEPALVAAFDEGHAALVRLGKFGSAESKTVEWRSILNSEAKHGEPNRMLNATTIWLAEMSEGRLPPGWAVIELADDASDAVKSFCQARTSQTRIAGGPSNIAFRPRVGMKVSYNGQTGTIIYEEDGLYTVELANGDEVEAPAKDLRSA